MRKLFVLFFFCISLHSFSQDTLIWKSGKRMVAHVLAVDSFVRCEDSDHHIIERFSVRTSELASVHYAGGRIGRFNKSSGALELDPDPVRFRITYLSTDLIQDAINEFNFGFEFKLNATYSFRIAYGKLYYNINFDPFILSPSQAEWPGTVYSGDAGMIYFKRYSSDVKGRYFSIGGIYKSMYYSNRKFIDMIGGHEYYFIRSEHADVKGFDVMWGRQFYPGGVLVEFNCGIGFRSRDRNITTYSVDLGGYSPGTLPAQYSPIAYGPLELRQTYAVIHLGLLIGLGFDGSAYAKEQ